MRLATLKPLRRTRPRNFPSTSGLYCEALESRQLLSVNDLLISTYEDTAGQTVLRYDADTWTPTAGGVATGNNGLAVAQGLVVAPNGLSFYVSSAFSGQVLHYDMDGNFLDVLGAGDTEPAPLQTPATLAFGPNGNLYVADLGSFGTFPGGLAIYQYDTSSPTQQYQTAGTYDLGFAPGGFTFADDGDLIVGDLFTQSIHRYDDQVNFTTLIGPLSGINPASILTRPNGDLLIGDIDLGDDHFGHHRVVLYDGVNAPTTFINFTTPVGTGEMSAGWAPQPSTMLYDTDGNLLIGVSPDHNFNGAVFKYDFVTEDLDMVISGIGSPTGLGLIPNPASYSIVGRRIFYNQSQFDGNSAAINASDNSAIAPDKTALLPGAGQATLANITNYTRGINGIIVDLNANAAHSGITANDFIFKVGANNTPSSWAVAPAPSALSVSMGGGLSGSDRVTITWADNAIQNTYLEIGIRANANTNLPVGPFTVDPDGPGVGTAVAVGDVFFFGNLIGETASVTPAGSFARSVAADGGPILAAGTQFSVGITNFLDINKSNSITAAADRGPIIAAGAGFLTRISIGTVGPFAPEDGDDAGIASALTSTASPSTSSLTTSLPSGIAGRLEGAALASPASNAFAGLLAEDEDADDEAGDAFSISSIEIDEELLETLASLSQK